MYKLNIDKSMGVATNLIVGRVQDLPYEKFSFKVYDKTEIIDLTGASIEFRGVNAIGGKIVQMDVKITNAKAGEFEFEVPKVFYSTMGKFTNAYFLIKRKGRVDSTEDLLINVLSGTEVSKEDAQIVIDGLDKVIADTIEKVSKDLKIKIDKQIADMNVEITKLDGDVKRIDKVVKDSEVKMNKLIVDTTSNVEQLKKDFEAKLKQLDVKVTEIDKKIVDFEKRLRDLIAMIESKDLVTQDHLDKLPTWGANLWSTFKYRDNIGYVDSAGKITVGDAYLHTDHIPIGDNKYLTRTVHTVPPIGTGMKVFFYGKDKAFISEWAPHTSELGTKSTKIPNGAETFVTYGANEKTGLSMKLEFGNVATELVKGAEDLTDLNDISYTGDNLWNPYHYRNNIGYIDTEGNPRTSVNYFYTDHIPIGNETDLQITIHELPDNRPHCRIAEKDVSGKLTKFHNLTASKAGDVFSIKFQPTTTQIIFDCSRPDRQNGKIKVEFGKKSTPMSYGQPDLVKHEEIGNLIENYPTDKFVKALPVTDLNQLRESGVFAIPSNVTNAPYNAFWTINSQISGSGRGSQIAIGTSSGSKNEIYQRNLIGTSWTSWVPLHTPKPPYARYIMHRGYHGETNMYPENSIRSFEGANGNFGVETDVRVTKDNKLICMHDATINRTTTGTGNVADLTLAQIRNFNLKTKFSLLDTAENDQKVPTLEEYLDINVRNGTVPFIEIKGFSKASDYDLLAKMIKEYNLEDTCYIISFNEVDLTNMRTRLPRVKLQFVGMVIDDANILKVKNLYPCDVSVNHNTLTQEAVDLVHSHGLAISVWTVNKEEDVRKMHRMGVDFISSDITRANNRVWRAVKADEYIEGVEVVQDNAMAFFIIRELNNGTAMLETVIRGLVGKELPPQAILVKNLPEWATPKDREVWSCSGLGRRDKSTEHEVNGINLVKSSGLGGRGWVTAGFALKGLSWLGVRATYSIGNY